MANIRRERIHIMEYATEEEMIYHCDNYPCNICPISYKCSMFELLLSFLPKILLQQNTSKKENIQ